MEYFSKVDNSKGTLTLYSNIDCEVKSGDDNNVNWELKLFKSTVFKKESINNLIAANVKYQFVDDFTGQVLQDNTGTIRYWCSSKILQTTTSKIKYWGENWPYGVQDDFDAICNDTTIPTTQAADKAAKATAAAATKRTQLVVSSNAELAKYPCLIPSNGLTKYSNPDGNQYYADAKFRYWKDGTKQPTSNPTLSSGNLSNVGWEPFDCATEFKTTTPESTVTTPKKNTQQVNRKKQYTQNTLAGITKLQTTLGVPTGTGQLKNSDIDILLTKLQQ
jgi:hypothetical protein